MKSAAKSDSNDDSMDQSLSDETSREHSLSTSWCTWWTLFLQIHYILVRGFSAACEDVSCCMGESPSVNFRKSAEGNLVLLLGHSFLCRGARVFTTFLCTVSLNWRLELILRCVTNEPLTLVRNFCRNSCMCATIAVSS